MSSSVEGPRFSEYTATDHQAPLWIATSITLVYASLFLIVRVFVKLKLLALDDLFLGVAYVSAFAQWGVTYAALHHGVGTSDPGDDSTQTTGAKLVFVSRILTLLAVGFSKCSVVLFLRQLFAGTADKGWNICNIFLLATGIWTVASALVVSAGCPPSGALLLESSSQCSGDLIRWKLVTALDVCLEFILALIPVALFYSVHISRTQKFTIFGVFFPRIIVPAIYIAYLEAYTSFRTYGGTSIDSVDSLIWQQVLCGYSLVSATTPCLNGFLKQFRTHDLAKVTEGSNSGTMTYDQSSASRTTPGTYALESLDRKNSVSRRALEDTDTQTMLAGHPAEVLHSATIYADAIGTGDEDDGDGSEKSAGSERMIIHRKIEFGVASS